MASRTLLAGVAIAVCAVTIATVLAADRKPGGDGEAAVTKWQHLALTHDLKQSPGNAELGKRINKLGRDGWELVSVENVTESGTTTKTVFYFKRRL